MKYTYNTILPGFTNEQDIITEFRNKISTYLGCNYTIPVTNGTSAIEIGLRGLGLQRGDFVIIPDISFFATATAVAQCGLIPVYADVSYEYFGLTLESLKNRISSRVKAVIVVHFSGIVNREILEIREYCRANNIALLEDCAQAFSCSVNGIKVGAIGDVGTFSFQSSKIINSGEGGLISTNNSLIAADCEAVSDWGMSPAFSKRNLELPSSNFRLSALQCYFLLHQLEGIDDIVKLRLEKCVELEKACAEQGIRIHLPEPKDGFVDCPFFFPVQSSRNINMIEPREETPLHRSTMVISILKYFYPDLLDVYYTVNPLSCFNSFTSNHLVSDIDFINIHNVSHMTVEHCLSNYTESTICSV